ncbi:MAG: MarC family protein [Candidatus Pacebacteria bacterium]|nr:MarC family protein [Candidatus Paceibacterota bacterium]
MKQFLNLWIKLFFVFTPFFGLTIFLSMTEGYDTTRRRKLALIASAAVAVICLVLFWAGRWIFSMLGISLDSFRVGAGVLLFLSGIALVHGRAGTADITLDDTTAVVPLAMPIVVGPATTGTLLVMGAELNNATGKLVGCVSLLFAVVCVAAILFMSGYIHSILGRRGISILSKLTGLVLTALAAQMIMTGVRGFFGL